MSYTEIGIMNAGTAGEALACRLHELGSTGFVEREGELLAYFAAQADAERAAADLEHFRETLASSGLFAGYTVSVRPMPEQDWNEVWKKSFVPIDVGRSLTIVPSWVNPGPGRIPVIIDPGMVFGTGHHASTRACLAFVEKASERSPKGLRSAVSLISAQAPASLPLPGRGSALAR